MSYILKALPDPGQDFPTVTTLFSRLRSPFAPREMAFAGLQGKAFSLVTGAGAPISFTGDDRVVRAVGLSTCASICFLNTMQAKGYVYHAPSGTVSLEEFGYARKAIGGDLDHLFVVLAHREGRSGYEDTLDEFESWGVPANNMVEITHLAMSNFGLNHMLQLGY
jgi:hypothetical protein